MNRRLESHRRRSIRLKEYDYSQAGAYFLTICTYDRKILFEEEVGAGFKPALKSEGVFKPAPTQIRLNPFGLAVRECWEDLPNHYFYLHLDDFVVMPNHVHGIIMIVDSKNVGAGFKPAPTGHALSEIIRGFKTFSARRINEMRHTPGQPVWQRNYYEHIIRNEIDLQEIREYIEHNPLKWLEDENHPENIRRSL